VLSAAVRDWPSVPSGTFICLSSSKEQVPIAMSLTCAGSVGRRFVLGSANVTDLSDLVKRRMILALKMTYRLLEFLMDCIFVTDTGYQAV